MQHGALSQSEIDSLLANLQSDEESPVAAPEVVGREKKIKAYNFRRPDKFAKEQMRSLQLMHESMARGMASTLSGRLRGVVQVNLLNIEQGAYDDYTKQVPETAVLSLVNMDPLPGHMILELSQESAFILLDRLLGGPGKPLERARPITEIELVLLRGIMNSLLDDIKEGWRTVIDLNPRLGETLPNLHVAPITFATDAVLVAVFEIRMTDTIGTMTFCLPYTMMEPVVPSLNARVLFTNSDRPANAGAKEGLRRSVKGVEVPVVANLGQAILLVRELLSLRPGDVIRLDTPVDGEVQVTVGSKTRFTGRPGLRGSKVAVGVTNVLADMPAITSVTEDLLAQEEAARE